MKIKAFLFAVFISLTCLAAAASAQETVTISVDDLKQFRKLAADRDYQKARADEAETQSSAWQDSAGQWKALYLSEKSRADVTQEGRITELTKANSAYKDQADLDKQRLGEMQFQVNKLKGERKWWFFTGLGAGAVGGAYVGTKIHF